jgi:hypothetical protein
VLIREEYQEAFQALIGWYKGEKSFFPMETAAETVGEGMDVMEIDFSNPFKSLSRDTTSKRWDVSHLAILALESGVTS